MPNLDPRGHYAALNVNPKAEQAEILLAYRFVRQSHRQGKRISHVGRIEEAWKALGNRSRRAEYDHTASRTSGLLRDKNGNSRLNSGALLMGLGALLLTMLVYAFGARLRAPFIQFEPGDRIEWKATDRPIGVVVAYEQVHTFPDGEKQAAYLLNSPSGAELWLPASDLQINGVRK